MKIDRNYEAIFAMSPKELQKCLSRIYKKAHTDPDFKKRLCAAPTEVLTSEGIKLQPNIRFQTIQNKKEAERLPDDVMPFLCNDKPQENELCLDELQQVAGGYERRIFGVIVH